MAEGAFQVTYDGPALQSGRMPVRDLAPALLALGDLFTEAGAVLYPDREPVALDIKATAEGSFDVHLILEAGGLWDQVIDLVTSDDSSALLALIVYVTTLFGAVKFIGRKLIKNSEQVAPGRVKLTLEDGETLEVPSEVLDLYGKIQVRKKARAVVEPLDRPGVDRLDFRREDEVTVSVGSNDLPAFQLPEEGVLEDMGTRERETVVAIAAATFIEGNKWRLTEGEQIFWATIEDEVFLSRVEHGEAFRKGDFLECRLRVEQFLRDGALHSDYFVTRVVRHIQRTQQEQLGELPPGPPP